MPHRRYPQHQRHLWRSSRFPPNSARSFPLSCRAATRATFPPSAVAYSLNVTVVPIRHRGLSDYLADRRRSAHGLDAQFARRAHQGQRGDHSCGNFQRAVSVFVTNTTNVLLDINGYFIPSSSSTLAFYPVTPCRLVDTRNAQRSARRSVPDARYGARLPTAVKARAFRQGLTFRRIRRTSPSCRRLLAALAYLTVWPQGIGKPLVSTLQRFDQHHCRERRHRSGGHRR